MDAKSNIQYWNDRAVQALDTEVATHYDRFQRRLELQQVLLHWPEESPRLLDVGCGAGWTTQAIAPKTRETIGVDRSPEMIRSANEHYGHIPNLSFEVGDVLALPQEWNGAFDMALSQRCLINLSGWEEQQVALESITRMLKPGGILILQEATAQGREALNQLREKVGLPRMPVVTFNRDFDETLLWPYLRRNYELLSDDRLGLYDLIARVVHPLAVAPNEPQYEGVINQAALKIAEADPTVVAAPQVSRMFSAVLKRTI